MRFTLPLIHLLTLTTALPSTSPNEDSPIELASGALGRPPLNLTTADHNLTPRAEAAVSKPPKKHEYQNPYEYNHGAITPVYPWKDGDGPWRWGRAGKRYSKRGCGDTCVAKCRTNKITTFWRLFLHPWPLLPIVLSQSHNRARLKSDCTYVCKAFCDYSADMSEGELASHFGTTLSVQTSKHHSDFHDDNDSSWTTSPSTLQPNTLPYTNRTVRFRDGKLV
ncbi:hypothetical protein QC761_406245 [Podospora bellae-mahoneyi]|uniref:Uncharacterized protein n=1 Tax=Podospora bellae-mahoneyi TaxID=2093777 RepID=A0ABR0FLK7_9PEZI|nr:hypothetical protein QC761_406245 [Podospora bellae-mahoneyi]